MATKAISTHLKSIYIPDDIRRRVSMLDKKPEDVKPTDFVELDYKRNLEYHSQVFFKDYFE